MFRGHLRWRGVSGSLLWGYFPAATLRVWTIERSADPDPQWVLSAEIEKLDAFQARQRPLRFAAPRPGGFWSFPVRELQVIQERTLRAVLGPPEQ